VGDEGALALELVGRNLQALDERGIDPAHQDGGHDQEADAQRRQPEPAEADVDQHQQRAEDGDYHQDAEGHELGVDIGVGGAEDDSPW